MMEKKRIHQVAREYHISSEALLAMLRGMSYTVKSHMSVVDQEMLERIRQKFEEEKKTFREEIKKKQIKLEQRKRQEKAVLRASDKEKEKPKERRRKRRRKKKIAQPETKTATAGAPTARAATARAPTARAPTARAPTARAPTAGAAKADVFSKLRTEEKKRRGSKSRKRRKQIDQKVVQETVRKTLVQIEEGTRSRRRRVRSRKEEEQEIEESNVLRVPEFISVAELAELMDTTPAEVISQCLRMGLMVTINQRLDMDTIVMVADEFEFEVEPIEDYGQDLVEQEEEEEEEDTLVSRPPVITIMGHVDHGKTSLLDHIRKSNIIAGESGGITQHIGAYEVSVDGDRKVVFLDTPGHEAFTAMRARGARVTDLVVLIVAADEDVMPQTIEAIDHARAAGVPIVVAINKMDLPTSDPDKIKRQLADHGVVVEAWGGRTSCVEISAKTGHGVDQLLETLALEAELLELTANPFRKAKGVIIESELDRGRGAVATVLVQNGTLRIGDPFVCGIHSGRVRALMDDKGQSMETAPPSTPTQVVGIGGVPQAGDRFFVTPNEREAREISQKRQQLRREQDYYRRRVVTLADIYEQIKEGQIQELNLIVKGDVDGSAEALNDELAQLDHEEVRVQIIHRGVGTISESDVLLAAASDAVIIGFRVRPNPQARELANQEGADIRMYQVIYEAVNDVKAALSGMLTPRVTEQVVGTLEVRAIFRISRVGTVAGCYVQSGVVRRNASARVWRDNAVLHEGVIVSLKRIKDDVREVSAGFECGIGFENFDDSKENDVIEVYEMVETARTLD